MQGKLTPQPILLEGNIIRMLCTAYHVIISSNSECLNSVRDLLRVYYVITGEYLVTYNSHNTYQSRLTRVRYTEYLPMEEPLYVC